MYLLNFDQSPSVLNGNVSLFAFTSDEAVGSFKMLAESVVSVNNGDATGVPADLSVGGVPVPKRLSDKEVVVFDLSSEWGRWDIENGFTSVVVMEVSRYLVAGNFPSWVFSIGVKWMLHISPSIIESLNGVVVWFLSHSND